MIYKSTRSSKNEISSCEAMINGIADDGGLYVPGKIPIINEQLDSLINMNYKELACYITGKFFTDFKDIELQECVRMAYDNKFDTPLIAPLVEKGGIYFLELYHGPTLAFKDIALTIMPHLLKAAMKKKNIEKEIVILTATSGDTGKAALEGFADIDGIKIIVFFPENGVSEIQKRQMITQDGKNVFVVGIYGNFDDAQTGVKKLLSDSEFIKEINENNYIFSSANSINIARLIPQIVYYFYSYIKLLKDSKIQKGESINVVVPTGNFGNILAAYYAKRMGLNINKLICASNENNVLYDFLSTGIYDKRRNLKITMSPSMDILISSNLERLLYEISGRDEVLINELMSRLQVQGKYEITKEMKSNLKDFYGGYASEQETLACIRELYDSSNYIIDTHTAVAYTVYKKYKEQTHDDTKTIIVSTASPFKFARNICKAIGIETSNINDFDIIYKLSETADLSIPEAIKNLKDKKVIHNNLYQKDEMKMAVKNFLNI